MKYKAFWRRMVPVLLLVAVTVGMSLSLYRQMMRSEEEICWHRLEIATNSTADKINTRINDNLNFLTAAADAYVLTHRIDDLQAVGHYLSAVMERTIFERIDVILPDNSLITKEGRLSPRGGAVPYDVLVTRGTHITQRVTSSFTGREVFCCVTPIETDGQTLGLLVGTIDCGAMCDFFEVFTYGEEAQLFLIDRTDGHYLMDNWHAELGNIYERGTRTSLEGEEIDFVPAVIAGERTRFSYFSRTNGERSYQFNAPVEDFYWTVCVVVQEDVAFANLKDLESRLLKVGRVGLVVVLGYVLWNIWLSITAARSESRVRQLEYSKALNEARGKFISNMSHDIKTPLNGIVGMLQIIRNHRAEENVVDECLDKIEISAQYLSTLASDMLDINEIENNKLVLPQESIDLNQLALELNSLMERQAHDAGVTYAMDHAGLTAPCILGSSVHIKRILVNLIGNAIKYSRNAGKNVWVTLWDEAIPGEQERRMYRFVVRDNGIGMSEEFQKKMYKAFEQEIIDARSEYQGYGLGLTIVSHLIRKMDGVIDLKSAKGQGSTFTVSIPFQLDPAQAQAAPSMEQCADISGMHLLLVEDNEINMEIAHVLLTDAGATVDMAVNGKAATELFAASRLNGYDAIIMDVMMPIMDGCEATRVIRAMARPDAALVPIIAMTASTFSEDITRCMEAGMNDHLAKPLDMRQLMHTMAAYRK